ncbi:hypothetical protein DAX92_13085 [Salmonella enterica subsp. enterica]|uniref:Uncharacterized protein n=2 Tax=Salmonella enterica TaxID=28901 RepID=A0A7Z1QDW8_SALET|nr:hypothetical protein DAX92_13085 [Salmonella enterica subsp. enterica]PUF61016.1 hypothetical protein DAX73_09795 [Salmonella enterica subsp. enterica]
MLSFGTSETGNGGDLTTVKTDGTTITGDGNTMPLALGPGEKDGIGGYVLARCPYITGIKYGGFIAGGYLSQAAYTLTYGISYGNYLTGTYRFCCMAGIAADSLCLVQRVA